MTILNIESSEEKNYYETGKNTTLAAAALVLWSSVLFDATKNYHWWNDNFAENTTKQEVLSVQHNVDDILNQPEFENITLSNHTEDIWESKNINYSVVLDYSDSSNNNAQVELLNNGSYEVILFINQIRSRANDSWINTAFFEKWTLINELWSLTWSTNEERLHIEGKWELATLKFLQSKLWENPYDIDAQKYMMLTLYNKFQFTEENQNSEHIWKDDYLFITKVIADAVSTFEQMNNINAEYFGYAYAELNNGNAESFLHNQLLLDHIIDMLSIALDNIEPNISSDIDQLVNEFNFNNEGMDSLNTLLASN